MHTIRFTALRVISREGHSHLECLSVQINRVSTQKQTCDLQQGSKIEKRKGKGEALPES